MNLYFDDFINSEWRSSFLRTTFLDFLQHATLIHVCSKELVEFDECGSSRDSERSVAQRVDSLLTARASLHVSCLGFVCHCSASGSSGILMCTGMRTCCLQRPRGSSDPKLSTPSHVYISPVSPFIGAISPSPV